ncbi:MAG: HU family DNA-binding protein, partial [Acidimicrobiaceae bacterium]|nr:HU family DNA-binding protein [Acidimicrobiaceae bacterium]
AETGLDRKQAEAAVKAFADVVISETKSGEKVSVFGFGTFTPTSRAARIGRNPQTNTPVKIAASKGVRFAPASAFKETLNSKKAAAKKTAAKKTTSKAAAKTAAKKTTSKATAKAPAKKATKSASKSTPAAKTSAKRATTKTVAPASKAAPSSRRSAVRTSAVKPATRTTRGRTK